MTFCRGPQRGRVENPARLSIFNSGHVPDWPLFLGVNEDAQRETGVELHLQRECNGGQPNGE